MYAVCWNKLHTDTVKSRDLTVSVTTQDEVYFLDKGGNNMFNEAHEECGVYGMYSKKPRASLAPIISVGLSALQHRGEESCRNSNK